MIFTSMKISAGGGEYSFFTEDGDRYTISVADAKRLSLAELCADDLPIEFDDDELIEFLSSKLSAIKYCTYLMSFSDKSESVLKRKMRDKGYSSDIAEEALNVLRKSGFTDDAGLCVKKYQAIAISKLYGPHRIKAELIAKGFSTQDINHAQNVCCVDFDKLLSELIQKLLKSKKVDFSNRDEITKFKAKLSRYGYGFGEINTILSHYCDGDDSVYEDY